MTTKDHPEEPPVRFRERAPFILIFALVTVGALLAFWWSLHSENGNCITTGLMLGLALVFAGFTLAVVMETRPIHHPPPGRIAEVIRGATSDTDYIMPLIVGVSGLMLVGFGQRIGLYFGAPLLSLSAILWWVHR